MRGQPIWAWILVPIIFVVTGVALQPVYADGDPKPARVCISNLKQLAVGCMIYGADFDDKPPLRGKWMDAVEPFVKGASVEHCPALRGPGYGYALNAGVRSLNISNPAFIPLVYDSANQARNASDFANSFLVPGRHDGKNNVCYVDGHAHAVATKEPHAKK